MSGSEPQLIPGIPFFLYGRLYLLPGKAIGALALGTRAGEPILSVLSSHTGNYPPHSLSFLGCNPQATLDMPSLPLPTALDCFVGSLGSWARHCEILEIATLFSLGKRSKLLYSPIPTFIWTSCYSTSPPLVSARSVGKVHTPS